MKTFLRVGLCATLACAALAPVYAWSVKGSSKTHVRVLVVDEKRKPVEGQKMTFRLKSGCGKELNFCSGKDGMVSFREDIGSYAICNFDLDRKIHYPVWFEFRNFQSGSVVTGVVKRIAEPSRMVDVGFRWSFSNAVHRVGVDLLLGDLVQPYGKGRCADLYLVNQGWKDDSVETSKESRKVYSEYWFERGEAEGEFSVVDRDVGCELPTPSLAPEAMLNNSDARFKIDYRPGRYHSDNIGEQRFVLFRIVRPNGVFYGVLNGGAFHWDGTRCFGELMYCINPTPGNRGIVWTTCTGWEDDWLKYVRKVYAEEDAERERAAKEAGKPSKKADLEAVARNRRIMEERAYSGRWECKAWGFKSVSFTFAKEGIGSFNLACDDNTGIFLRHEIAGRFYWTADDMGAITARAVGSRYGDNFGVYEFRMMYDCSRNVMIPDLKSGLFVDRVAPSIGKSKCELMFVSDAGVQDVVDDYLCQVLWRRGKLSAEDELITAAPKKQVASLEALCTLAKKCCREKVALVVRGNDAPEIRVGLHGDSILVGILCEINRAGDIGAPKFECLAGECGPDIAGKKAEEVFFDGAELEKCIESLDGELRWHSVTEEGAWTLESWRYADVWLAPGKWGKCKEVLKPIMDKWYTFPIEVREVDFAKRK